MATKPEVVVITGASAGLGRATVQAFARRGAHIGLLARSPDGLEGARRDAERLGGKGLVAYCLDQTLGLRPALREPIGTRLFPWS